METPLLLFSLPAVTAFPNWKEASGKIKKDNTWSMRLSIETLELWRCFTIYIEEYGRRHDFVWNVWKKWNLIQHSLTYISFTVLSIHLEKRSKHSKRRGLPFDSLCRETWAADWSGANHGDSDFLINVNPLASVEDSMKSFNFQFDLGWIPSGKQTQQWKIPILNRKYIFKWWIFHCYVRLPEGNCFEANL